MPPAGFESTIPISERSQTHALDRAATGIGDKFIAYLFTRLHGTINPSDCNYVLQKTVRYIPCAQYAPGLQKIKNSSHDL
jgi:hypothetical protein